MLQTIVGILLLAVAVVFLLRLLKNFLEAVLVIGLILLASYFLFGSLPSLKSIPLIGPWLEKIIPSVPTSIEGIILKVKNIAYSIKIMGISRDSEGNLLVIVSNDGKMKVSGFKAYVDNKEVAILNEVKELDSGETVALQLDWKEDFSKVEVETSEGAKDVFRTI